MFTVIINIVFELFPLVYYNEVSLNILSSQEIFLHKTTVLIKPSKKNSIRPNLATITKELQTQKLF